MRCVLVTMHPTEHMRLTFSTDHCVDASIFDDHGQTLYMVSTGGYTLQTTITKINGPGHSTEVLAGINWRSNIISFQGREIDADHLLRQRRFATYAFFLIEWTKD